MIPFGARVKKREPFSVALYDVAEPPPQIVFMPSRRLMRGGLIGGGPGPGTGDPDYASVSTLLHFDGLDTATSFTDNAPVPLSWTANGNAQLDTAKSQWGGASLLLDGTGDYVSHAATSALAFGSGDFSIEFWFWANTLGSRMGLVSQGNAGGNNSQSQFYLELNTSSQIESFWCYGGSNTSSLLSATLSTGQWYFLQLRRQGNNLNLILNGTIVSTVSVTGITFNSPSEPWQIGQHKFMGTGFNGWIDDFRVTKGVGRAPGVPTAAFPDSL